MEQYRRPSVGSWCGIDQRYLNCRLSCFAHTFQLCVHDGLKHTYGRCTILSPNQTRWNSVFHQILSITRLDYEKLSDPRNDANHPKIVLVETPTRINLHSSTFCWSNQSQRHQLVCCHCPVLHKNNSAPETCGRWATKIGHHSPSTRSNCAHLYPVQGTEALRLHRWRFGLLA